MLFFRVVQAVTCQVLARGARLVVKLSCADSCVHNANRCTIHRNVEGGDENMKTFGRKDDPDGVVFAERELVELARK